MAEKRKSLSVRRRQLARFLDGVLDTLILPHLGFEYTSRLGANTPPGMRRPFQDQERIYSYLPPEELRAERRRSQGRGLFPHSAAELTEKVRARIDQYEENLGGARIGLSFRDLHGEIPDVSIYGSRPGWAASTIKVPVMIAAFQEIDAGRLALDDGLEVDHRWTLEDYDPISLLPEGQLVSVLDLICEMIVFSDNEATNMLADYISLERINRCVEDLGTKSTMIAHLLARRDKYGGPIPRLTTRWNRDGSNLTSADDLSQLMTAIYSGKAASSKSCQRMQEILEISGGRGPIGSYLPATAIVGGKIGHIFDPKDGEDLGETAVINGDYVLTMMCNQIPHFHQRKKKYSPEERVALRELSIVLDDFHRQHSEMPFYFRTTVEPVWYHQPVSPSEVISTISKAVHDVYYGKEQRQK